MKKLNKQKKLALLASAIVIIIFAAVSVFVGIPLVKYVSEPEQFRLLVDSWGIFGALAYVVILIFQIIFAFIPGEPFEILAGYAFGAVEGTLLCLLGSCIGSAIVFSLTRKFGIKFVEIFFSADKIKSVKFLHDKKKIHFLIFIIFFIPGTPKDLLSYVAGLTPIGFWQYLVLSTAAKIPSIITSTIGGSFMGDQQYNFAVITFIITGAISAVGLLIYNRISGRKEKNVENLLNKTVMVIVNKPLGSEMENGKLYGTNYGFLDGVLTADGEFQEAYVLGVNEPVKRFKGKVIAVLSAENAPCRVVVAPKRCYI
ncbi:MAG: TVP38/TMEM64 family protein [Clostridia bacterium]|nr:TVP38/TMEM64 family protein [Clostridia bacterium]